MQEVLSFVSMGCIKFKIVIHSFVASYTASTMRFFKQKRAGKRPSLESWLYFGITGLLVSFSVFALLEYFYPDVPFALAMTFGLWAAYNGDYIYSIVPKVFKTYVDNKMEPLISHTNDADSETGEDVTSDSGSLSDDPLRSSSDNTDSR